MSRSVANVEVTTDTWSVLLTRVNTLLDAMSNEYITANSTYANTGTPAAQRNAQLFGAFVANTFVVATEIKGGSNTSTFANLSIGSNAVFTGAAVNISSNVSITGTVHAIGGNVSFDSGVLFVDSVNNRIGIGNTTPDAFLTITGTANVSGNVAIGGNIIVGGTLVATGNATLSNTIAVTGATTLSNTLAVTGTTTLSNTLAVTGSTTFQTELVLDVAANGNIGTSAAPRVIYSFPKATYRTCKVIVQADRTGNNQIAEMVIAHDNTNAYATVYGVVASPAGGNTTSPLGTFTAAINTANVELSMVQTGDNTAIKVVAQLIK